MRPGRARRSFRARALCLLRTATASRVPPWRTSPRRRSATKGAVYHYFGDKRDILQELRDQVSVPMLDEADCEFLHEREMPALERVERYLLGILQAVEGDEAYPPGHHRDAVPLRETWTACRTSCRRRRRTSSA